MLSLTEVKKTYRLGDRTVEALRGVSFEIEEPGFYAVMGKSGSGKSTLLHLAAGLDRADGGVVCVDGQDLAKLSEKKLTAFRRTRLGIVFQQFNLIATLSAAENVGLPGVLDRRPKKWIEERVGVLLEALEIGDRGGHRPDALSGGEQQRVAIARALLFEPPVLYADEPTGSLDSASSAALFGVLRELAQKRKVTVVMVTHEPSAAVHCEKVFVLGDGVLRGTFDVEEGTDATELASRYQRIG